MSGNNEEWKKFGGVAKVNSFNVINTGTLIADQFVSRSSRPTNQSFNGSLEVTVDLVAGNDAEAGNNIHAGNSITAFADIFINQNAYINHKIFFFSTDPTSDASLVDLSSALVSDTSHAFIAGDISNIGINIVDPKTIFHISCDVSNVTDILTVESSNGLIRSIMSQTKDKKGIVFDASNETSNIAFFNGGEDVSTNKLNTPTAFIRHVSGGFLSINTSNTVDVSSATFFVDTSGVNLKLDGSGVVLESSGSIIIDTSSSFQLDSSRGFFLMDASTGAISMGASGELRILTSVSDDNIGSIFVLNKEQAMLSTSGGVLINSSGGIIELNATNKGEVIFNSGSFNLNTTLNFAPPDIDISSNKLYNETITIYDNSLQDFFPNIYNHDPSGIFTGAGMVIRTLDPSNNTNMRLVSAKSGKGAQITGGVYPDKNNDKNMAMFGVTDLSHNFTSNHMVLSGSERHNKLTTLGINTFKPLVDEYILDINGPVHINNSEINTVTTSNFEYQSMSFSKINPLFGIACGSPSSIANAAFTQILLHTNDGGKNWIQSNIYEQEADEGLAEEFADDNKIDYKQSFLFDNSYGFIAGNDGNIYYTNNGGIDLKRLEFSGLNSPLITALGGTIRSIDNDEVYRFFSVYTQNQSGAVSEIRTFDISASDIESKLKFSSASVHKVSDAAGEFIISRTLRPGYQGEGNRIDAITSIDISGRYLYLVGETGIDRIDASSNIMTLETGGYYPRTISSSDVGDGITELKYKDVFAFDDTHAIAIGDNLISTTIDGETWSDGSLNVINNIGDVSLNKCIIIDTSNALIVGDRGTILHSNNWSNVNSWTRIPNKLISQSGSENLLLDPSNDLISIAMPEKGIYLIENNIEQFRLEAEDLSGTPGFSRMEYFTAQSMFHNSINNVLDISGNITATGDLFLHNGSITADNIKSATNGALTLGGTSDFLNIGECSTPETMFRNVGNQSFGTRDLSDGYKVINIGANTASHANNISPYVINIGNHEPYTESAQYKGNKIFIGGGDDIVVIDGSGVEFKSQAELTVNSTHVTLNFSEGDLPNSGPGCGFKIKSDGDNRAGFIESSLDNTGYVLKAPSGIKDYQQNILKIDTSNSILHPGITTGLMVLKETQAISGGTHDGKFDSSFVMLSANLDLSNILIRNPTFEAPHDQYTEDVMQRITSGLLIEGDLSCNNRLFIEKDVNIRGQLTVEQYQSENIITTTTNNYTFLTVAEDMSLNGRLFVRDDVSLNGSVYIDNSLGIATHFPVVALDVSTVDAIKIPRGSTADRPETVDYEQRGYMRYNTDTSQFEGYGPGNSWVSLGGAVDVDQDTFISAERGAGTDNDQLHFFTASGDTINVPHLRAVIDGSGLTIGSQLCEDVSNNTLTPDDPDFPGPRPPQDGLWVQGDASFNTHLRAQDMSVNMLKVKDASINRLKVLSDSSFNGHISATDVSINTLEVQDVSSTGILYVTKIQSTNREDTRIDFGDSLIPYASITGLPEETTNVESVPIGGVIMWANAALIPFGFYMCDGGQLSSSNPNAITSFEAPQGTITIPDLRGKFVVGYNSTDSLFSAVGNTGGSTEIGATQLPSHTHSGDTESGTFVAGAITGTISTENAAHTHSFNGAKTGLDGGETVTAGGNGSHWHYTTGDGARIGPNSTYYLSYNNTGYSQGGGSHHFGYTTGNADRMFTSDAGYHDHSVTTNDHQHSLPDTASGNAPHSHTFTSAAGTGSHDHTFTTDSAFGNGTIIGSEEQQDDYYPPYYTMVYIIRYTTPLDTANQIYGKELYYVPRQLSIGPNAFAELALDMRDCSDGILFPKGTTAERPNFSDSNIYPNLSSLQNVTGTMRYNTDNGKFEGYAGLSGNEKWGSIGGGVMDQDEDTFIRANGANDEDSDQLHFFTASGDTINVPHLRAVMDGSGFTIGSQLSIDVSNTRIYEIENGLNPGEGPLPPENGLWVQGDVSFNSNARIEGDLSCNSNASIGNSVIIGGGITHDANYKLYVNGNMQATSYNALSDERLKQKIYTLSGALETINQLRGVSYYWKKDYHATIQESKNKYGFIAQEIEQILPNIITTCSGESYTGIFEQKSVNYNSIIPWLVEAVKELTKENTELKQKVSSLEESMIQIKTHLNL